SRPCRRRRPSGRFRSRRGARVSSDLPRLQPIPIGGERVVRTRFLGGDEHEVGRLGVAVEQVGAGPADELESVRADASPSDLQLPLRRGLIESVRQPMVFDLAGRFLSGQAEQSRTDEHLEADQGAHRVARQRHPGVVGQPSAALRSPGLHGDGFEDHGRVRIEFGRESDDFVRALGDAAGGDDDIGLTVADAVEELLRVAVEEGDHGRHADDVTDFASLIPAAASATISSPVLTTSTRGRVRTLSSVTPQAAATPRWAGVSIVPALRTLCPARTSLPRARTKAPARGFVPSGSSTEADSAPKAPGEVASILITVAVPAGSGAPVMIATAVPSSTGLPRAPGATRPRTGMGPKRSGVFGRVCGSPPTPGSRWVWVSWWAPAPWWV